MSLINFVYLHRAEHKTSQRRIFIKRKEVSCEIHKAESVTLVRIHQHAMRLEKKHYQRDRIHIT